MSTEQRLEKLLKTSKVIPFDHLSKFVIMSDCHRGVGNWGDNFSGNQNLFFAALSYYYSNDYTYIELGDGDELWENRDMKQIIQVHSDVFWMLSRFNDAGRLYMLSGNHDITKKYPAFMTRHCSEYYCERTGRLISLFPDMSVPESLILKHVSEETSLLLVHGHQGDFLNDTCWQLARFLVRYLWRPLELLALHDPTSAAKNHKKKDTVEQRLTHFADWHSQILVAGHTHRPMFPSCGESLYFNCGSCVHPRCITALEIAEEQISLVKWSVMTREDLSLYVGRELLEGPLFLNNLKKKESQDTCQIFDC